MLWLYTVQVIVHCTGHCTLYRSSNSVGFFFLWQSFGLANNNYTLFLPKIKVFSLKFDFQKAFTHIIRLKIMSFRTIKTEVEGFSPKILRSIFLDFFQHRKQLNPLKLPQISQS